MGTDNLYKLIFTGRFLRELEQIDKYLLNYLYSPQVAKYVMNKIDDTLIQISMFPKSHERIPNTPYRKVVIKKYIILYELKEKTREVYMIHIFHSKSDYQRKLNSKGFNLT